MNCLRVWRHVLVGVMAIASVATLTAGEQTATVTARVNLRGDASTRRPPVTTLTAGTTITLLDAEPANGFYHARLADGRTGWIAAKYVRTNPRAVETLADCGDNGAAAAGTPAALLNQRKHAAAPAGPATVVLSPVDFSNLQDAASRLLPDGRGRPLSAEQRAKLQGLQTSAGRISEGAHVAVVGYMASDERPDVAAEDPANCSLEGEVNNTIHVRLGDARESAAADGITVSLEPRGRPARWSAAVLERVRDAGLKVRASGLLLYNNMPAPADAQNSPVLWEIHPAGALEVCMRAAGDCPAVGPDGWRPLAETSTVEITNVPASAVEPARDVTPLKVLPTPAVALPAGVESGSKVTPAVGATRKNTYVFDHAYLEGRPGGRKADKDVTGPDPAVLEVRDGEYFQIVIANTDPRKFTYRINALETDDTLKASDFSAGALHISTDVADLRTTSVTMRHRKEIAKYRVHIALRPDLVEQAAPTAGTRTAQGGSISARAGGRGVTTPAQELPPATDTREGRVELYSVDFDVWVRTRDNWTTAFTSGVAFSGLTDHHFYIRATDDGATPPANVTRTFEEDKGAHDLFKPELAALVNLWNPSWHNVGVLFGMGLNNSADPRYMVGGSYYLGRQFVLTGGLIGGKVRVTPSGQSLGDPPINDNVLATVTTRFEHSWFFGLGFEFSDRKQFILDYFASGTGTSGAPAEGRKALTDETITGTYTGKRGNDTVTWTVSSKAQTLTIKEGSNTVFTSTERTGDTFKSGEQTAEFRQDGDTVSLTYKDGKLELVLKKKAG